MKIVNKPWGYEKWIHEGKYVLKEICMKAGLKSSLQYHRLKDETNYILRGKGVLYYGDMQLPLKKGVSFHIPPNGIHLVKAITDLLMIEASTPEVDDVIRLADDTNRPNGRIESEHE